MFCVWQAHFYQQSTGPSVPVFHILLTWPHQSHRLCHVL
uniref:Uncharacterized protein n=1 Tax=Anguilla anguilla TaxID=7936 RepID=A0A0E9W4P6_ANGAN